MYLLFASGSSFCPRQFAQWQVNGHNRHRSVAIGTKQCKCRMALWHCAGQLCDNFHKTMATDVNENRTPSIQAIQNVARRVPLDNSGSTRTIRADSSLAQL